MKLTISFEYYTESQICRVCSLTPRPPFGIGEVLSVLHDSHNSEAAKKELRRSVEAALKKNLPAITVPNPKRPGDER